MTEPQRTWARLGAQLADRGQRLMIVEASAGGVVSAAATAAPGASAWFEGGVVAYGDRLKRQVFSVSAQTIEHNGAVSPATVAALLAGAEESCDWVWAESGIYGPGGARPGKPVGTVHMGIRAPDRRIQHKSAQLSGTRDQMRSDIQQLALDFLWQAIRNFPAR